MIEMSWVEKLSVLMMMMDRWFESQIAIVRPFPESLLILEPGLLSIVFQSQARLLNEQIDSVSQSVESM